MHIRPIEPQELATFVALYTPAEHLPTVQNEVDQLLAKGAMQLDRCFVLEDTGTIIGRIAYWTMPSVRVPLAFVLFDVPWDGDYLRLGTSLLAAAVADMRRLGAGDIEYTTDTPPQPELWQAFPELRHDVLTQAGFTVERVARRFRLRPGEPTTAPANRLHFRSLTEVGEPAFLQAIERVSTGSLDQRTQTTRTERGAAAEAQAMLDALRKMESEPDWWQLAYTDDDVLVGLVMPTRGSTFLTIGYIGVVPEQRGHGYIDELLAHGTATLRRSGTLYITADTDISNVPMADAFSRAGYTEFTMRREYFLKQSHT